MRYEASCKLLAECMELLRREQDSACLGEMACLEENTYVGE